MKFALKSFGLLVVGVIAACLIYPTLHEVGHSLTAILVGASVIEISFLPIPSVLCGVGKSNMIGQFFIGLGGYITPYILSRIRVQNLFWLWYAILCLKVICAISFGISAVSIIFYLRGINNPTDDISQMLNLWSEGKWLVLICFVLLMISSIMSIIREAPLKNCINYFNIKK